jgi:DNA-directed RNA polymerase sigma subunit (sigma70/sigma32)
MSGRRYTTEAIPKLPLLLSAGEVAKLSSVFSEQTIYIDHPSFHEANPHICLFPRDFKVDTSGIEDGWRFSHDPDAKYLDNKVVRLTKDQERTLFLQSNYARSIVYRLRRKRQLSISEARKLLYWQDVAEKVRNTLWLVNLPLIMLVARQRGFAGNDFGETLLSSGIDALNRAINRFDISYGFAFSTYAYRAILTALWRASNEVSKVGTVVSMLDGHKFVQRKLYYFEDLKLPGDNGNPHDFDPEDPSAVRDVIRQESRDMLDVVQKHLPLIPRHYRMVLRHRLGLSKVAKRKGRSLTLSEIQDIISVSKERVRQMEMSGVKLLQRSIHRSLLPSAAVSE